MGGKSGAESQQQQQQKCVLFPNLNAVPNGTEQDNIGSDASVQQHNMDVEDDAHVLRIIQKKSCAKIHMRLSF